VWAQTPGQGAASPPAATRRRPGRSTGSARRGTTPAARQSRVQTPGRTRRRTHRRDRHHGRPGFGFEHFSSFDFLRDKEVVLTFDDGPWPLNTPPC